ncbi:MarR family transcriptional regulator [Dehalogenimonas etheniformans]|uniref:MarR family transcriptional regulator n=1 Tax=Dehalogenimonas etheniformans TaxID=1536648 RepID=UPI0013922942|nr:MarR family transcriptional regulator [Dehalogenimonas etheniformans]
MNQILRAGKRTQDILTYIKYHPGATYANISKHLGLSSQRVSYLIKTNRRREWLNSVSQPK